LIASPWGLLPAWLVYPFAAILGGSLGSFANVLIYRLPAEMSLVRPPSRCPKCNRPIRPWENIPVISWILLRGKCRGCGGRISIQYPIIEAVSASIIVFSTFRWGVSYPALAYGLLMIGLLSLIIIDLRHMFLPFLITIPLTIIGFAGALFYAMRPWSDSLIGMAVGFGVFLMVMYLGEWIFKKEALGGGDVVFGMMAGAFLGWKSVLLMIFMASFLGVILALILLILRKQVMGRAIPFGPFLAVATAICVFVGDSVVAWYVSMLVR
jgi:leader peptidase (prepilin peptidase) / N-methyltransferase